MFLSLARLAQLDPEIKARHQAHTAQGPAFISTQYHCRLLGLNLDGYSDPKTSIETKNDVGVPRARTIETKNDVEEVSTSTSQPLCSTLFSTFPNSGTSWTQQIFTASTGLPSLSVYTTKDLQHHIQEYICTRVKSTNSQDDGLQ